MLARFLHPSLGELVFVSALPMIFLAFCLDTHAVPTMVKHVCGDGRVGQGEGKVTKEQGDSALAAHSGLWIPYPAIAKTM